MNTQPKIPYQELKVGFELPCTSYELKPEMVANYIEAVSDDSAIYDNGRLAPPMAVAACAMKAISDCVMLPPGVVHTHGDIRFSGTANTGEIIDCYGKVSQQLKRGSLTFLTMDFSICNHKGETILEGQTGFILPEDSL